MEIESYLYSGGINMVIIDLWEKDFFANVLIC